MNHNKKEKEFSQIKRKKKKKHVDINTERIKEDERNLSVETILLMKLVILFSVALQKEKQIRLTKT